MQEIHQQATLSRFTTHHTSRAARYARGPVMKFRDQLVRLSYTDLMNGLHDGSVPYEGGSMPCNIRDMSRIAQSRFDPDQFIYSVNPSEATSGLDGYNDAFGAVRLDDRYLIIGLRQCNYDLAALYNWSRVFDTSLIDLSTTVFNAIADRANQAYYLCRRGHNGTWVVTDVSSRVHGIDRIDRDSIAIAYDGMLKCLSIKDAVNYLMGRIRLDWSRDALAIGVGAKVLPVHVGFFQVTMTDGYMTIYDRRFTVIARHHIGVNRLILPKFDQGGRQVDGMVVIVDSKDGKTRTQVSAEAADVFPANREIIDIYDGRLGALATPFLI